MSANHSKSMSIETAVAGQATSACNPDTFAFSSALPGPAVVIRTFSLLRPWSAGLLLTVIQLTVAVFLLAPEGPLSFRYQSLVQHDGYWFANIIDRGYQTTVPPINHKVMEVSNVAFFPAYPALAAVVRSVFRVETETALLIAAQLAALDLGPAARRGLHETAAVRFVGPESSTGATGRRSATVSRKHAEGGCPQGGTNSRRHERWSISSL